MCSRSTITESKGETVPGKTSQPERAPESPGTARELGPWLHLTSPPLSVLVAGAPSPTGPGCSGGCGAARSSCQVTSETFVATSTRRVIALILGRLSEHTARNGFEHYTHK